MYFKVFCISLIIATFSHNLYSQGVEDSEIHYKNGNLLYTEGRYFESIAEFKGALKVKPNETRFLNGIGAAYLLNGEPEKAIETYKKSCKITEHKFGLKSSRTTACKSLLSTAYEKAGKLEESIHGHKVAYEAFLEREGKDHEDRFYWLQHLINPLIGSGRYKEAIKYSEEFLSDRSPSSKEYQYIQKLVVKLKMKI